jgi:hypothetical protein
MTVQRVEVLTFEGCPNAAPALELVERIVDELGVDAEVRRIDVPDREAAAAHQFLGSPSIRVNGRDGEPGASERSDYVFSCRVYRGGRGLSGQPEEQWVRNALVEAA